MKNIKYIIAFLFLFFSMFILWVFYPIFSYNENINNQSGRVYITDRFDNVITDKQKENGYFKTIQIDYNSIFIKDLLKIEDKDFYSHYGVDIKSKIGAIIGNLSAGKIVSGGSTITEQYIKNKYFLGYKRTYLQKIRESFMSLFIDIKYNKNEILENYLNNIYFGNQIYGIGGAIQVYFGKSDLNKLSEEEITLLISLIHNPGIKSLKEKKFKNYFNKVKNKLSYNFKNKIKKITKKENIDLFPFITNRIIENKNNREIIVKSSIDGDLQKFSKQMLNETLDSLKGKNVTNGAIIAFNPKTMEVLVYQGSRDYNSKTIEGQVDVITALRQPGSTLKPFLYLLALKKGINPDDLIIDIESKYNSFKKGSVYVSENYSLKQYGLVRFKKALGNSFNNASVRLAKELGLNNVWQFFKDYGINLKYNSEHYGYSLVLGNPSISLENLVLSYVKLLPNFETGLEGKKQSLNSLKFVFNHTIDGNSRPVSNSILDVDKFLLYDILKNPDNRDISFGVNSILNTSIFQAVKTGTSSDFRDNLVVSYNPNLIVGIWIGNNDNSSMIGVSGITGAGYLWHQIIEKSIEKGIITDNEYENIPKEIEEGYYCLDKKCFRKEIVYKKTGKEYKSYIIDSIYSYEDIFEKISKFELEKLKDLGFNIKK